MITLAPALGAVTRRTSQRMMGLLLAGAIAFAGMTAATPARSDNTDDLIRFLFGVAAIAVIINAIDDNQTPPYVGRWVLPDQCLETVRVNYRQMDVYNARCLRRAGYTGLPNYCRVPVRTYAGNRPSFLAQCLYEAGYRRQYGGGWSNPPVHPGYGPDAGVSSPPYQGGGNNVWLPWQCAMTYRQNGQRVSGYDGACLASNGFAGLPTRCRVSDAMGNRYFNASCLANSGYRTNQE